MLKHKGSKMPAQTKHKHNKSPSIPSRDKVTSSSRTLRKPKRTQSIPTPSFRNISSLTKRQPKRPSVLLSSVSSQDTHYQVSPLSIGSDPMTKSRRNYDIPRYTGFRTAFDDQLRLYAQQPTTPVSLHHFLHWPINHLPNSSSSGHDEYGGLGYGNRPSLDVQHLGDQQYSQEYQAKIIENAQFLWKELPIRLAKRVVELENLPYGLSQTPQFLLVRHWFESSFRDVIQQLPPVDPIQERNFTRVLNAVLNRHRSVIPTLAQGVLLQKPIIFETTGGKNCPYIKNFLDGFYSSRIALRMLIAQHIALHKPTPGFCGTIHLELDPVSVIRGAAQEAADLCERTYGVSADINIFTSTHNSSKLIDQTFPSLDSYNPQLRLEQDRAERKLVMDKMKDIQYYSDYKSEPGRVSYVSSHLHHMVFEILKNSARAHAEHYVGEKSLPDINVFVSFGEGDTGVSIKISDVGGGIPLENQSQLFSYLFTTADPKVQEMLKRFDIVSTINKYGLGYHDDHITMLAPNPAQLSKPLSIRSKTGLMSISNSSIMGPTEGNGGGSVGASISPPSGSNPTNNDTNTNLLDKIAQPHSQSSQSMALNKNDNNNNTVNSSLNIAPPSTSTATGGSGGSGGGGNGGVDPDDGGVFLIANEQQGFGSGMQRLAPISGFGYGAALSRLFARFGNGDLTLYSSEGHGTDAILSLTKALSPGQKSHEF